MDTDTLIRGAEGIAHRLVRDAIWNDDSCAWQITVPDVANPGTMVHAISGGSLYQGTSGIALFLMELWSITRDERLMKTIRGAMTLSMRECEQRDSRLIGLYAGSSGIACVASRFAELTQDDEWASMCTRLLARKPPPPADRDLADIIAGSAGTVLALLRMHAQLGDADLLEHALILAAHCERSATQHPFGWSWSSPGLFVRQDLCGYAHGASGVAHAFLESFARTGDPRWRHGAVRALQYERFQGGPSPGQWWDFRQPALGSLAMKVGGLDEVRALIARGEFDPPAGITSMRAWCHGSPGAAVVRARAASLSVDAAACTEEAIAALAATADQLATDSGGYSLCHGTCGNAESLLLGRRLLGDDSHDDIERVVLPAIERFEFSSKGWPSGVPGNVPEPSLLLGDAGIGHFLLRLANQSIPSALFFSDWSSASGAASDDGGALRAAEAVHSFKFVGQAAARIATPRDRETIHLAFENSETIAGCLDALEARESTTLSLLVRDAVALDGARIRAEIAYDDYTAQLIADARQTAAVRRLSPASRYFLAPHCTLIRTRFAWDAWINGRSERPLRQPEHHIIFRRYRRIYSNLLPASLAVLLVYLRSPRTTSSIAQYMRRRVSGGVNAPDSVDKFVNASLASCLSAGIVVVANSDA